MAYIYVITNKVNNKQYIGKTIQSIKERFQEHKYRSKYGTHNHLPLYAAIAKYTIDNFVIEQKEEVDISQLDDRESFWIKELNTLAPNGYNLTLGGEGTTYHDRIEILKLFEQDLSFSDIVKLSKSSASTICRIEEEYRIKPKKKDSHKFKPVYMFSLEGELLKQFDSVLDAIEYLKSIGIELSVNSAKTNILKCCRREPKRKTAYKYIWRYTPEL